MSYKYVPGNVTCTIENYLHAKRLLLKGNLHCELFPYIVFIITLYNCCFIISGIENISFGQNSKWPGLFTSTTEFKGGNTC